ncbi:MAG: FtsX-like permease family protein [Bacteroidia bacterium]|jgi:ABC-type lipoprotein release transport system permease subunit|nr:FtsX-like permease family protein [Bacteroidia bacterium]
MKDFQLAWRNIWRNKRRTLITAASVFFAIFFALVMRSFQLGAYDRLFKNVIESYSGYLQLQHKDYSDEPVLDNSFVVDQYMLEQLKKDPNVRSVVPRLESFALAAAGSRTQGTIVMGIDPERENEVSDIIKRLVKFKLSPEVNEALKKEPIPDRTKKLIDVIGSESYASIGRMMLDLGISLEDTSSVLPIFRRQASFSNYYFNNTDTQCVIIGDGLSDYLKISVGDTLVLMGQGYHGTTAAGKYVVKGIVKLPTPDIDNIIVYIPINSARELYAAPGMATSAVFSLKSNSDKDVLLTAGRLKQIVSDPLVLKPWRELNALLVNQMEADSRSGMIMIGILYLVIAFGVFGTVLMMMAERRREFGMLISIGMQKRKLAKVVSLEILLLGFVGIIAGVIASLPVVIYGNIHPIRFTGEMARMYEDYGFEPVMPTLLPGIFYLWQIIVVLIILVIAITFSVRKIFRIKVISALRA